MKFLAKLLSFLAIAVLLLKLGDWASQRWSKQASSVAVIGGADGPTSIYVAARANPEAISRFFGKLSDKIRSLLSRLWL